MALEVSGKLIKLLPKQTGEGKNGPWSKQDFVIETSEQFPKKICFSAWGERATQIETMPEGTDLKVSFDVQSREYNDRWYTDLKPWKIDVLSAGSSPSTPQTQDSIATDPFEPGQSDDDLPF
ncbi:MAG: DUF3127 domain-containing protein [Bacteroidota bacterium]|nr:DUF3127 domain-containing protein [Bacteroidota bacterium]